MSTSKTIKAPAHTPAHAPTHAPVAAARSGVSFELQLDASGYVASPTEQRSLTATMMLHNFDATPLSLTFAGGRHFDVEIRDTAGTQVALWSTGRMFDDLAQSIEVTGERRWQASMPVPRPAGGGLVPVSYTATAYLTCVDAATPSEPMPPIGVLKYDISQGGTGSNPTASAPRTAVRAYSATVGFTVRQLPVLQTTRQG